jgi:hypothetical protein
VLFNSTQLSDDLYQKILDCFPQEDAKRQGGGNSGSYMVYDDKGNFLAIIKPASQEALAPKNIFIKQRIKRWFAQHFHFTALQTQAGQGVYAEAAAYTIGVWIRDHLDPKLPDIVPYTVVIHQFPIPKQAGNRPPCLERVSLQCGANLPLKGPILQPGEHVPVIVAEKLFYTSNRYYKKTYPPLMIWILNFLRKWLHMQPILATNTPWRDKVGAYLKDEQFAQGQFILHEVLKEQFALMSLHNYIINDVDKHGQNWLIVGEYENFITAISENRYDDARVIAKTFRISSIDNGAAFAPQQQKWWHWLQTRNRLQYHRLEVAKIAKLPKALIETLWRQRSELARLIWGQYQDSEALPVTHNRVRAALERLAAVYELSQSSTFTVVDMCRLIKNHTQIQHYAKKHQHEVMSTLEQLRKEQSPVSVQSTEFVNIMVTAVSQAGRPVTFKFETHVIDESEEEDCAVEPPVLSNLGV